MKIKVAGSDIKIVKEELVVVGTKKCFEIEFCFDKSWRQMTNKTAVLYQPSVNRDNPIIQIIGSNNKISVPTDGMIVGDYLYIGVFGFNESGTIRLPTIFTYTYVSQGAYAQGTLPVPENSVYEQIYNMALNAYRKAEYALIDAENVKTRADNGDFDGADGAPGFSPTVAVKIDTSTTYILTITTEDGSFDTPNLIGSGSGDLSYVHDQSVASKKWEIHHNLKKYPSVTVVDSAGSTVIGDVNYTDLNSLIVTFSSEFSGVAYLN